MEYERRTDEDGEPSGNSGELNSPAISESCDGFRATGEALGFKDPYKVGQLVRFYGLDGTYSITNGVWVRSHNCVWSFRVSAICRTGDDEGKVVLMPAENVAWASDVRCLV